MNDNPRMADKAANTITTVVGLVLAVVAIFTQSIPTAIIAAAMLICGELCEIYMAIEAGKETERK